MRSFRCAVVIWSVVLASFGAEPCETPSFQQWVTDRRLIDAYEEACYQPYESESTPFPARFSRADDRDELKVISGDVDPKLLETWRQIPSELDPSPGFAIDESTEARWKLPADAAPREIEVAAWIRERLPCGGILQTAADAIRALGDTRKELSIPARLRRIGFPVSLLRSFRSPSGEPLMDVIRQGRAEDLAKATFKFERADRGFEPAFENGETDLTLARMEIGGSVRDGGIVPGSGLDVAGKLVESLPDTKFIVSVPQELLKPLRSYALASWPLKHKNHVTLLGSALPVSGWAQDNGKGGLIRWEDGPGIPAVLAPRYASIGEAPTVFNPGESLVLASLDDEGVRVLHSNLLFQGGNLLIVRDPATRRRLLFLSENEIARNRLLGLTQDQIIDAFKTEFAVDRCVVLPLCSYHLDFDVTFRTVNGKPIALVNDPIALARQIIKTGVPILAQQSIVPKEIADAALKSLGTADEPAQIAKLEALIEKTRLSGTAELARLTACFKSDPGDVASANLARFCVALDWLLSVQLSHLPETFPASKRAYLAAMNRKSAALREQREILQREGFTVVGIPSMPDLKVAINYLNGISDRTRFLMPAISGFYTGIDQYAAHEIRSVLGPEVRVIPIPCANLQQHHGALHCMVSIFPADIHTP